MHAARMKEFLNLVLTPEWVMWYYVTVLGHRDSNFQTTNKGKKDEEITTLIDGGIGARRLC